MKNKNIKLNVLQDNNETCYQLHEKYNVTCKKVTCKNWFEHKEANNCVLIASKSGPKTLQEIGKIYGLTRMRICQIEKGIYEKIRLMIQNS